MAHITDPTAIPAGMAELVRDSFLAAYSGGTLRLYRHHLDQWFDWCRAQGVDPLAATRLHVELYYRHRLDDLGNKPATVGSIYSALKGYYRIAVGDDLLVKNPVEYARKPQVNIDDSAKVWLTRTELHQLIHAARLTSPRHDALIHMLAVLGLRVSEACSVDIEDYHGREVGGHPVVRVNGKGSKAATMPLTVPVLRAFENARGDRSTGPLVTTLDGRRLNRHTATGLVHTVCRRARIKPVSPHVLRRSAITGALDSGVQLRDVQHFARHARPDTTMRYDRGQGSIDRHAVHVLSAFIAS